MRIIAVLGLVGLLAACGADGAPITPEYGANVSVSPDGVSTNASVGVSKGPFSLKVGL